MVEIKYKKQGDGRDTWRIITKDGEKIIDSQMYNEFEVPSWKLKLILDQIGLLSSIEPAINNLEEPNKSAALFAWNNSPSININSTTTNFVKQTLNLTNDEVASIFEQSNNLKL